MAPVDLLTNLIIYCLHKQSRGISLAEHGRFASEFGRPGTSGESLELRDPNMLPPNRPTMEQAFDSHVATIVFNGLEEKNSGILGAVIAVSILRSP